MPEVCWREGTGNDRIFEILATPICTYLATECRNRSENFINRNVYIFYIDFFFQFFFQVRKNIFFGGSKKKSQKKNWPKIFFGENPGHPKILPEKNRDFQKKIDFFFNDRKKIFFSGVEKKIGTQFRCRNCRALDL